jgi:hypothetical protein
MTHRTARRLPFFVWNCSDIDSLTAVDALAEETSKVIQNIRPSGKPTTEMLDGLAVYGEEGTGEIDGTKILWSSHLIQCKRNR